MVITFICAWHSIHFAAPLVSGDTSHLKIGMNIGGPTDYGSDWPFVDVMKFCRTWGTMNHPDYTLNNKWDTPYADSIRLDALGNPLEVPFAVSGADTVQVVFTVWAHTKAMPLGIYTFLYDGDGDFRWALDAREQTIAPGRITVRMDSVNNIALLVITRSNPNNPVRNMRFLMPGTETTFIANPFNQTFLERLKPFKTIRFMDFGLTNASPLTDWNTRSRVDYYTYTTSKGVPYEWMIRLCNTTHSNAWVCVPHLADSNYILQMAQLFHDSLNPDIKIYVEYTNEWWNWMFAQAGYLVQNGDQNVLWPERTAPFFSRCMSTWKAVFADNLNRIERVFGTQHYWPDLGWRVLRTVPPGTFDAVAPAAYIGLNSDTLNALGANNTVETILQNAMHEFATGAMWGWREHKAMADSFHLRIHFYEGGQHFTPNPFGSVQPYAQALMDVQTDPRIYPLYRALLDSLTTFATNGISLFCHFALSSEKNGRYGCWGALESIYQTPPYFQTAPKYQALLDFINGSGAPLSLNKTNPPIGGYSLLQNFPNPFNPVTTIRYSVPVRTEVNVTIFDVLGHAVAVLVNETKQAGNHEVRWNAERYASGVYFYQIRTNSFVSRKKLLLLK